MRVLDRRPRRRYYTWRDALAMEYMTRVQVLTAWSDDGNGRVTRGYAPRRGTGWLFWKCLRYVNRDHRGYERTHRA